MIQIRYNSSRLVSAGALWRLAQEKSVDDAYVLMYNGGMFTDIKPEVAREFIDGTRRVYESKQQDTIFIFVEESEVIQ